MTTVAIIGPGRVGTLLAVAFARAGHRVTATAGGSQGARAAIAELVAGVRPERLPADAARRAALVVLAVPDDALAQVVTDLAVAGSVGEGHRVVHVAGSHGLGPLERAAACGARVAACHPAMTVPTGARDPGLLVGTAWAVTAPPPDRDWAHALVHDLGGDPHDVGDDVRTLYHAGLSVGANAVGAAVAAARQLLIAARVDDPKAFLDPLVRASVANVTDHGAVALTGPIARGDVGTVSAHRAAIAADVPELLAAYESLARATLAPVAVALAPEVVRALEEAIAGR